MNKKVVSLLFQTLQYISSVYFSKQLIIPHCKTSKRILVLMNPLSFETFNIFIIIINGLILPLYAFYISQ